MEKRYLSIWLPFLATDRLHRRGEVSRDLPLVLTREDHGRSVVTAVNPRAMAQGLTLEMTLAMAKAICADLIHLEDEPAQAARLLEKLADWCDRFTPLVALNGKGDSLILDVSGCCHLYGGERAFIDHAADSLKGQGFIARMALASTPGAARAFARHGRDRMIVAAPDTRKELSGLPVAALGEGASVVESLTTVGLETLGHLYAIPRAALANRYGMGPARSLDRMLGDLPDPISPRPHKNPYRARLAFPDPIGQAEDIQQAVLDLMEEVCQRLEDDRRGARQFHLRILKTDNTEQRIAVGTGAPSHHAPHLMRLFAEKLTGVEPGFGIDCFLLSASVTEPVRDIQSRIGRALETQDEEKDAPAVRDMGLIELADRLRNRLGPKSVFSLAARASHLPDRAQIHEISGAGHQLAVEPLPAGGWPQTAQRPIRIFSPPHAVQLLALASGKVESMLVAGQSAFRWRGTSHHIRHVKGPERIAPDWWMPRPGWQGARDYYRVEDETGGRYWLYRERDKASGETRWFLHGVFR